MNKKTTILIGAVLGLGLVGGFFAWRTKQFDHCDQVLAKYGENTFCVSTSKGNMVFELYPDAAPQSVAKLKALSNENKLYDGLEFYRLAKDFVVQGGVERQKSRVSTHELNNADLQAKVALYDQKFPVETNFDKLSLTDEEKANLVTAGYVSNTNLNTRKFEYGMLSFANADANSNSTEIFIVTEKDPNSEKFKSLNGKFTPVGKIIAGQDVLDKINSMPLDERFIVSEEGSETPKDRLKIYNARAK